MEHNLSVRFDSSIKDISEINESFSSAPIPVCYTGENNNKSDISKESIERAIPSMFNCPVVCNYDVESDVIGGHDMEIVSDADGNPKLVNLTSAVGVIPSEADYGWEMIDDDGVKHEYFYTDVILWKRSPAYEKIAADGVVGQSMEITVKEGRVKDGVFIIDDFIFTAFCLLGEGIRPCFESASLQLFSNNDELKAQFGAMMQEFKESFSSVQPSKEDGIDTKFESEGGSRALEEKLELMAKYGLSEDMLDFKLDDFSVEELEQKFNDMKRFDDEEQAGEESGDGNDGAGDGDDESGGDEGSEDDSDGEPEDDGDDDTAQKKVYQLNREFLSELRRVVAEETIDYGWGPERRYWFEDYDADKSEVYVEDCNDWLLYGFTYSIVNDSVIIDWDSKKRKKYEIVDFVGAELPDDEPMSVIGEVFSGLSEKFKAMTDELSELRSFKSEIENKAANEARNEIFAQFADLAGNESFEALKAEAEKYSASDLEEKCFAIRGRSIAVKFSAQSQKVPKIGIEKQFATEDNEEPYGGIFKEFGIE